MGQGSRREKWRGVLRYPGRRLQPQRSGYQRAGFYRRSRGYLRGGLETTLIFENGYELPEFAEFPLLDQEEGRDILRDYYRRYIHVARKNGYGFILEGPTYRASSSWGRKLGYSPAELKRINTEAISLLIDLKNGFADESSPMLVSGFIGPQGDGYQIDHKLTKEEAEAYHQDQIAHFKQAGADLVAAYTINYTEEAIGIVWAAQKQDIAAVISFTVETDGRLPSGQPPSYRGNLQTPQGVGLLILNRPTKPQYNSSHRRPLSSIGRFR